jgi:hypothetical protein
VKSDKFHLKWFVLLPSFKSLPSHDNTVSVKTFNTNQPTVRICKGKTTPVQAYYSSRGFQEVETPRFRNNRHMKVVRLSALSTGLLYHTGNIAGTHFCHMLSRPQCLSAAERIMSIKNSDTISKRTRNLPAYSAVPQPNAPPRAKEMYIGI